MEAAGAYAAALRFPVVAVADHRTLTLLFPSHTVLLLMLAAAQWREQG